MEQNLQVQIDEIKEDDFLVGFPSFNEVRTIGHVVRTVPSGLLEYSPDAKAVLINSDGGSTDGTQEGVLKAQVQNFKIISTSYPGYPLHKIVTSYHGIPGKGTAFRTIFEAR